MTEPTAAPPPSARPYPQWKNHALLVAGFAVLGAIVVFLSYRLFPPSGRSGDIIRHPHRHAGAAGDRQHGAARGFCAASVRRAQGADRRARLRRAGRLLAADHPGGRRHHRSGGQPLRQGAQRCDLQGRGDRAVAIRIVEGAGRPALQAQLSSPATVSGPLCCNFSMSKTRRETTSPPLNGSLPAGFSGTIPTGKRMTITAPLTPVNQPVAFVEFSLCWKDGDPDTCLVYSYGENTHPNDGSATQCAQLPKPSGAQWPPPL